MSVDDKKNGKNEKKSIKFNRNAFTKPLKTSYSLQTLQKNLRNGQLPKNEDTPYVHNPKIPTTLLWKYVVPEQRNY